MQEAGSRQLSREEAGGRRQQKEGRRHSLQEENEAKGWSHRGLNPGPVACKATTLPLSYDPIEDMCV